MSNDSHYQHTKPLQAAYARLAIQWYFTFLNYDGIPWNNNNAEHAIKPFAAYRRELGGTFTEKGIKDYLILLSIQQTCKYRGLSFLEFLKLGEKSIEAYTKKVLR